MSGRAAQGNNNAHHDYDDDGRMDTIQDEDNYDDYDDDSGGEYNELDDEDIDLDIQKDDEPTDLERRFNVRIGEFLAY